MTTTELASYHNGNCFVRVLSDGTKIREYSGEPKPVYPETADIKITNYCDNPICAKWCHEKSNRNGLHGNLESFFELTSDFPVGFEAAIGGGNPFSHPKFTDFLIELKKRGHIANVTVNQFHIPRYEDTIIKLTNSGLIKGLGVSLVLNNIDNIKKIHYPNLCFHIINGIHSFNFVDGIIGQFSDTVKVLILGYKEFGNGIKYLNGNVVYEKLNWFHNIHRLFRHKNLILSFDNLAIEQLKIQRFLSKGDWNKFYMGDDGNFSCYFDCVAQKVAKTSTSQKRVDFSELKGKTILSHINQ